MDCFMSLIKTNWNKEAVEQNFIDTNSHKENFRNDYLEEQ